MTRFHLEPKRLRMVHTRIDKNAAMVLVESVKKGGAELKVLPPLFLYRSARLYTEEVERILEGECL
jgi:tRNA1(Val) A37 N6-methylase TrmN6